MKRQNPVPAREWMAHHGGEASLGTSGAGLRELIESRSGILASGTDDPALVAHEHALREELARSFAPSMLECTAVDLSSPPAVLEHLIHREAVHPIAGWADLRRRLDPQDRRCFGLFHRLLPEHPVAFVEIALTDQKPTAIDAILDPDRAPLPAERATRAVLFSISSTEPGLRGIRLGADLIARALTLVRQELPGVTGFGTLSPLPGFRQWLAGRTARGRLGDLRLALDRGEEPAQHAEELDRAVREYLSAARPADDKPLDPVARFHLGNGARLDDILLDADPSPRAHHQSYGVMVSYAYEGPHA